MRDRGRLGALALFGALALVAGCEQPPERSSGELDPDRVYPVQVGDSPAEGPEAAWVTLVVFSDFQCPYCARVVPTLEQLGQTYGADLRVVFKHFPLAFHARALPAARAAECARDQGAFWPMHDLLFAHPGALSDADLQGHAAGLAIDAGRWQTCFEEGSFADRVAADVSQGKGLGVEGTPTFFVNGRPLVGAQPLSTFRELVDAEVAKAKASGIPAEEYYRRAVLGEAAGS